jgi:hypothetical protein
MKLIELHGITKHYHLGQTPMTALKLTFDTPNDNYPGILGR